MVEKSSEAIIAQFVESGMLTGAIVETVEKNPEALNVALTKATAGDKAVLFARPDYVDPELFELFLRNEKVITNPSKEQFEYTSTGVTDAFCAIASTGSVCVSVSKNLSSQASFLTTKHIAVVDALTIVPRPRDVFSEIIFPEKKLNKSFTFITGPSATADMGPLVIGVHGPGQLHIVVLE